MSENTRIFPRYSTKSMKIEIGSKGEGNPSLTVENVSLGGLRLSAEKPVKFDSTIEFNLKLGSQEFNLNAYSVWNQTIPQEKENSFNYGFRLVFSEEDSYRRWMTFMKALHQHQKNLAASGS